MLQIEQGLTKSKFNTHVDSHKQELAGGKVSFITLTVKGTVISVHN